MIVRRFGNNGFSHYNCSQAFKAVKQLVAAVNQKALQSLSYCSVLY